ncbi:S1/P1 nuclease [Lutimonas sp.]|uniref:S1/P1 nuclease n=1 Tax=Lutimonas sp. TaxID=1872403 RepID=UPI003D9B5921
MKNLIILFLLSFVYNFSYAHNEPNWGATGHRTIGEIAENHLSKKAKKEIDKLLNGQGLAIVSTYGDDIKSDDAYDKYYTWHFVNFPFDVKYENSNKNDRGDIVMGIEHCIKVLKDPNASEQDKTFFLKFLVHLVGDLHQPLHVGRGEDRGGNDIKVEWHRKKSNLHRVWDSEMIEFYNMSYSELAANRKKLSKAQIEAIQQGDVLDWTYESQTLAKKVYASVKPEEKLSYRYSYDHFDTVLSQLQKSGIRLAKILNDIYN